MTLPHPGGQYWIWEGERPAEKCALDHLEVDHHPLLVRSFLCKLPKTSVSTCGTDGEGTVCWSQPLRDLHFGPTVAWWSRWNFLNIGGNRPASGSSHSSMPGKYLFAFWLISPFLFFNFVKAQRGIWRLSRAPPDSRHCITINYQARLCWELHLAWYKNTACWQCGWLRVKPEWLNNIPIISVMRSPHSWNLANPVGKMLTDQLGHEGPDSLRPQRGNSEVDDQMGIAAKVRSKGFEEKLWKAML